MLLFQWIPRCELVWIIWQHCLLSESAYLQSPCEKHDVVIKKDLQEISMEKFFGRVRNKTDEGFSRKSYHITCNMSTFPNSFLKCFCIYSYTKCRTHRKKNGSQKKALETICIKLMPCCVVFFIKHSKRNVCGKITYGSKRNIRKRFVES
jgi:hypothetical protein